MKYSIDRIEGKIAILESLTTKEQKEILSNILYRKIDNTTFFIYEKIYFAIIIADKEPTSNMRLVLMKFISHFN